MQKEKRNLLMEFQLQQASPKKLLQKKIDMLNHSILEDEQRQYDDIVSRMFHQMLSQGNNPHAHPHQRYLTPSVRSPHKRLGNST